MRAEYDVTHSTISRTTNTPEYLKQALGMKKPRHSRSASNGYVPGTPDYKEKEDMYDEIIDLKKTVQALRAEAEKMKVKLRRLEEENTKKDRQIEQLLDPNKGSEFTRGLVDRRAEGSTVINGLKQKILRLEQQYKEKESALSKLQSELKTTDTEELKITAETYYAEVQRLRMLLESTEKSMRLESRDCQRQQKALSAMVAKLSKNLKQLEEENQRLKQEVTQDMVSLTDSPTGRAKGYIDWSKQRLVRRILELERRLEDAKNRQTAKESNSRKGSEAALAIATATGTELAARGISVATETDPTLLSDGDQQQDSVRLRGVVKRLREERRELQERLSIKDEELKRLLAERDKGMKEEALNEEKREHEREIQQHREEVEKLTEKISCLEETLEEERRLRTELERSQGDRRRIWIRHGGTGLPKSFRHSGAYIVHELTHSIGVSLVSQDIVLLQSALRGHLVRLRQLERLREPRQNDLIPSSVATDNQSVKSNEVVCSNEKADGLLESEVTLLQSVFRAHLQRSALRVNSPQTDRSLSALPPLLGQTSLSLPTHKPQATGSEEEEGIEEEITEGDPEEQCGVTDSCDVSVRKHSMAESRETSGKDASKAEDSDDSDDIIISPSRPFRKRESYLAASHSPDLT
ncbi:IQ domain-containing protein E [Chanos chanos]|uniref:IQ domain-containing protein E n=1 Tax=Chanos chanos TaxID=29144 RepID=A0A6J2VUP1_CHACN|nr:IQ domain-containing protein E [Chanos chanos]